MSTIKVGQIVAAFGIKGQVKVKALTDFAERFDKGRRLRLEGKWIRIEDSKLQSGQIILSLEGVTTRNDAEDLQWKYLEAAEEERPELDDDEFLTSDLIGLRAVTLEGEELGVVSEVLPMPAHDVFVIEDHLVPVVREFVLNVDLTARVVTIKLIEGM
ncbi:MAG: ribosome maturation factor RimM [Fimbriimonadaceae bacterium]